jgi:hypothetical protein
MMHERKASRQPLFWAAVVFSLGLWTGARAWRPPLWWMAAIVVFAFAALWFLRERPWLAKALSLGVWFLLGALLIQVRVIQVRGQPELSAGLSEGLSENDGHQNEYSGAGGWPSGDAHGAGCARGVCAWGRVAVSQRID